MPTTEERKQVILSRVKLLAALGRTRSTFPEFQQAVKAIQTNANRDYLGYSLDNPTQVSYSPLGRNKYDTKRRVRTKLGRYLRRQFDLDCTDERLDQFTKTVICGSNGHEHYITIISGKAILAVYRDGVGGNSCMAGSARQDYVRLYSENSSVRMMLYNNGVQARALLFTCDDGTVVLDRIYPNDGVHVGIMQAYAESQGWVYRVGQSLPSTRVIELSDGKVHQLTLSSTSGYWPYMDTFHYIYCGDSSEATLSNSCEDNEGCLDSTDGSFGDERSTTVECLHCGELYDYESEGRTFDNGDCVCDSCLSDCYTWSDIEQEYISDDCIVQLQDTDEYVSEWYASVYCYQCDSCSEHFQRRIECAPDFNHYCRDCFEDLVAFCDTCNREFMAEELDENCNCQKCADEESDDTEETEESQAE